jgi:hypothetical protein
MGGDDGHRCRKSALGGDRGFDAGGNLENVATSALEDHVAAVQQRTYVGAAEAEDELAQIGHRDALGFGRH